MRLNPEGGNTPFTSLPKVSIHLTTLAIQSTFAARFDLQRFHSVWAVRKTAGFRAPPVPEIQKGFGGKPSGPRDRSRTCPRVREQTAFRMPGQETASDGSDSSHVEHACPDLLEIRFQEPYNANH